MRIAVDQDGAGNGVAGHGLTDETVVLVPGNAGLHGRDGQHWRGFCETVAGKTGAAELFFDFADQRGRGGRAAQRDSLQGAQVVFGTLGTIDQGGGHGRNEAAKVDALGFDEAKNFWRVEALHHDMLAAEKSEEMRDTPAVGVE